MGGLVSTKNRPPVYYLSLLGGNVCLAEHLLERASLNAHACLAHGGLGRSVRVIRISSNSATDRSFRGIWGRDLSNLG